MKIGRPSLPREMQKNNRLWLRLTDEELKRVEAMAKLKGIAVADFHRSVLLTAARKGSYP
jgi:uncharacterized protein (DUF1778 family)